jgi:hypothetical protein
MLKNYKDLKVWQKSYELCLGIYTITAKFPKEEIKSLENKLLNPWTLVCLRQALLQLNWRRTI